MENPQTWGLAEHVVADAMQKHEIAREKGVVGISVMMAICNALREAGLLVCDECGLRPPDHKMDWLEE